MLLQVKEDTSIQIGKLAKVRFEKGEYLYVGSAQNSLEKRIQRHLKKHKKKFWHIDYLLSNENVEIKKVFCFPQEQDECGLAKSISNYGKPINNFGSSDCTCPSHLYKIRV